MAEKKADTAKTEKATAKPNATKSAGEGENLPSASAPAVASEAQAKKADTTLTAGEAVEITGAGGDLGPFQDTAPPTGAALDETIDEDEIDTTVDFPAGEAFTEVVGDVQVSVREHNQRNIVEITPVGWVGPGQVFAPYQVKLLAAALNKAAKRLR